MTRLLSVGLVMALLVSLCRDCTAQPGQVTVVVPTTPGQPSTEGVRPEPPVSRKGGKAKYVIPLPKEYEAKDKNGDGQIGLYEWDRSKYAEFFKLDKNGDGFLTPQELTASTKTAASNSKLKVGAGETKDALPNPGNMVSYNQKIGEIVSFTVTGQAGGSIWGTGTYTSDSNLATVAVHAGVLKDGETGVVRVTIVESPPEFMGSTSNGVTSGDWTQPFPAGYTVR